jgi:hypothetical protein
VYWERAARFNQLVDGLLARVDPGLTKTAR